VKTDVSRRLLIVLLRVGAVMTGLAFLSLPMPVETMVAVHRWLGLGELPSAPIVEYLARSVSAFYGFHGVLLFLLSTNVDRFAPIITFVAVMNVLFGLILIVVDVKAGLPALWVALEGPPVILIGIALALLNRAAARERAVSLESPTW
jgi:hypothetical protein